MKKTMLTLAGLALVTGLSAAPAFADAPNGSYVPNPNQNAQGNCVATASAQIIQNGQFVSQ